MAWSPNLVAQGVVSASEWNALQTAINSVQGNPVVANGKTPSSDTLYELSPRIADIIAQVLDGACRGKGALSCLNKWIAWIAKLLWVLVEATVPRRPFYRIFGYWFQLLLAMSFLGLVVTLAVSLTELVPFFAKSTVVLTIVWLLAEWVRSLAYKIGGRMMNLSATVSFMMGIFVPIILALVRNVNLVNTADLRVAVAWSLTILLTLPGFARFGYLGFVKLRNWLRARRMGADGPRAGRILKRTPEQESLVSRVKERVVKVAVPVYAALVILPMVWMYGQKDEIPTNPEYKPAAESAQTRPKGLNDWVQDGSAKILRVALRPIFGPK